MEHSTPIAPPFTHDSGSREWKDGPAPMLFCFFVWGWVPTSHSKGRIEGKTIHDLRTQQQIRHRGFVTKPEIETEWLACPSFPSSRLPTPRPGGLSCSVPGLRCVLRGSSSASRIFTGTDGSRLRTRMRCAFKFVNIIID